MAVPETSRSTEGEIEVEAGVEAGIEAGAPMGGGVAAEMTVPTGGGAGGGGVGAGAGVEVGAHTQAGGASPADDIATATGADVVEVDTAGSVKEVGGTARPTSQQVDQDELKN